MRLRRVGVRPAESFRQSESSRLHAPCPGCCSTTLPLVRRPRPGAIHSAEGCCDRREGRRGHAACRRARECRGEERRRETDVGRRAVRGRADGGRDDGGAGGDAGRCMGIHVPGAGSLAVCALPAAPSRHLPRLPILRLHPGQALRPSGEVDQDGDGRSRVHGGRAACGSADPVLRHLSGRDGSPLAGSPGEHRALAFPARRRRWRRGRCSGISTG